MSRVPDSAVPSETTSMPTEHQVPTSDVLARTPNKGASEVEPKFEGALRVLGTIWALAHALDSRSKWMARNLGVTGPQRMAIRILGRLPGLPAGELARHLHIHPSTLTGVLHRLEERGFVARARDTSDARRAMLLLTRDGSKIDSRLEGTAEQCLEAVMTRYSDAEIDIVERVLADLSRELVRGIG